MNNTVKRIIKSTLSSVLTLGLISGTLAYMENPLKVSAEVNSSSSASSAGDSSQKAKYPVEITTYDGTGKPVKEIFTKAPERVVAVYQSPIETLLALGQGDRIVLAAALDTPVKDEYKEEFSKIKYQEKSPSKEEVLGAEPDFITSWYSYFGEKKLGDANEWINKGINTYIQANSGAVRPNSLENEYNDIINMGKIFGVEEKAVEIVDSMKAEIKKANDSAKDRERVKAAIIEVTKEGQYRVYGYDSIGGDIAKQAGAELVADKNGSIGKEDLLKLNPDVIFVVYFGSLMSPESEAAKITGDESLRSLMAVEKGRVIPIVLSEVYATGVRTMDGIKTITKGLYPELN